MRSSTGPLPPSLSAPRLSARTWLALAAGIGCGVCAYAGLYPRFDDGKLRLILALTSAPFGAAVVAAALSAPTAARAFGRTMLLSALLGMASSVLPAFILAYGEGRDEGNLLVICMFGFFFGAPTGALYGLPLGILSACGHAHVRLQTHERTDRAARIAGVWILPIACVGFVGTETADHTTGSALTSAFVESAALAWRLPSILACAAALGGMFVVARAMSRLRARTAWLGRVRAGLEPTFRIRSADLRDEVERLPRVGDGVTVVEWLPDEGNDTYRASAMGIAIALVDDRPTTA